MKDKTIAKCEKTQTKQVPLPPPKKKSYSVVINCDCETKGFQTVFILYLLYLLYSLLWTRTQQMLCFLLWPCLPAHEIEEWHMLNNDFTDVHV